MRRAAAGFAATLAVGLPAAALLARDDRAGTRVYAASSLRHVLEVVGGAEVFSYAGSNQLLRQIEAGAPADVLASASPREPAALHAAGRCTRPRAFATNRLVVLVPRAGGAVRSVRDLGRAGLRLALGAPGVPVGDAGRASLRRLGIDLGGARVSSEPSVAGVVAKVALGSAQAGIAYATEARAAGGRVRALPFPAAARPAVEYHVCEVLRDGADRAGARRFVARLTGPAGRAALARAGFGRPGR